MPDTPSAERYVAGTLTAEEVSRFEAAMIDRPELAADVGVRQRIRAGLSLLEQRGQLAPLLAAAPAAPRRLWRFAALIVAVVGSWIGLQRFADGPGALLTAAQARGATVSGTYTLALTRTRSDPTPIVTPGGGPRPCAVAGESRHRIRCGAAASFAGSRERVSEDIHTTVDGGFVNVYLDPSKLAPGVLELQLTAADGSQRRFPFDLRIERQPGGAQS